MRVCVWESVCSYERVFLWVVVRACTCVNVLDFFYYIRVCVYIYIVCVCVCNRFLDMCIYLYQVYICVCLCRCLVLFLLHITAFLYTYVYEHVYFNFCGEALIYLSNKGNWNLHTNYIRSHCSNMYIYIYIYVCVCVCVCVCVSIIVCSCVHLSVYTPMCQYNTEETRNYMHTHWQSQMHTDTNR